MSLIGYLLLDSIIVLTKRLIKKNYSLLNMDSDYQIINK